MEKIEKGIVGCTVACVAPCFGMCLADTGLPILDVVGTSSGYYSGYKI